ncbi:hypothetical protein QCA50_005748 [Cerrena zonata]|uniref:P-loop containing nucleoside triphosphate hydrolase protein n=1 Tax=Cerrena zonata TaxID=2478898 RepID=A0AAW0GHK0_9APHY
MLGRTIILVTHKISLLSHAASSITFLDLSGNITKKKIDKVAIVPEPVEEDPTPQVHENSFLSMEKIQVTGQLVADEEVEIGHVRISALKLFFGNISGVVGSIVFATSILTIESVGQFCGVMETWSLSLWTKQYDLHPPSEIPVLYYLGFYLLFSLGSVTLTTSAFVIFLFGSIRASRKIHDILVQSVLGTTWRWLDTTPTSRIIVRFTQDIQAVDGPLASYFSSLFGCSMQMVFRFTAILIVTPSFALQGLFIGALGIAVGQAYMKAQLPLKRETSITRSNVVKHLATAISGLVSIRAYGVERIYKSDLHRLIDQYSRAARTSSNLNKWITVRIDIVGALFVASLATYLLYGGRADASASGFSLTLAVSWCGLLFWWVRVFNDVELECNSLERIDKFTRIEQEPTEAKSAPPAYWPTTGDLIVENLSARYSSNGPLVLKGISFRVNAGERVALVGRTGSGKSSLVLSLLQCIPTDGEVYFDGVATHSISPNTLRSKITVIPQVPELLHGTLRQNLDPFSQYDDAELFDVLQSSGLSSLQDDSTETARITLDSVISGGGTNLSVGQRQIIALARALLRRSKLVILDEATSAIDTNTDSIIQNSLRQTLESDVSVITVAHRLHTIMDSDKIIVLDAGRIVEIGSPRDLIQNDRSRFRAMVMQDGDRDMLLRLSQRKL